MTGRPSQLRAALPVPALFVRSWDRASGVGGCPWPGRRAGCSAQRLSPAGGAHASLCVAIKWANDLEQVGSLTLQFTFTSLTPGVIMGSSWSRMSSMRGKVGVAGGAQLSSSSVTGVRPSTLGLHLCQWQGAEDAPGTRGFHTGVCGRRVDTRFTTFRV